MQTPKTSHVSFFFIAILCKIRATERKEMAFFFVVKFQIFMIIAINDTEIN